MSISQKKRADIHIRLEPQQHIGVHLLASRYQTTMAEIIRQALDEYLDKPQIKAILNTPLLAFCATLFFMID